MGSSIFSQPYGSSAKKKEEKNNNEDLVYQMNSQQLIDLYAWTVLKPSDSPTFLKPLDLFDARAMTDDAFRARCCF